MLILREKHLGMKGALIENTSLFALDQMISFKTTESCTMPSSVEATLESKFNHDRSKITGLETMDQQMQFIKDSEIVSLETIIIGLQEFDKIKACMMTQPSDLYIQEYIDKMMEKLLVQRNNIWVKQTPEIASKTPIFFGVTT